MKKLIAGSLMLAVAIAAAGVCAAPAVMPAPCRLVEKEGVFVCKGAAAATRGSIGVLSLQLPEAFVGGDRDGVGEVDAAGVFARHGDLEKGFFVSRVEVLRKPGGFVAEDKRVALFEPA